MYTKNNLLFRIFTVKTSTVGQFWDLGLENRIKECLLKNDCGREFVFDSKKSSERHYQFDLAIGNNIESNAVRLSRVQELLGKTILTDTRYTKVEVSLN